MKWSVHAAGRTSDISLPMVPSPQVCATALIPPHSSSKKNKTMYVCPMHPQVRQDGPGDCSICGMALEPEISSVSPNQSHDELWRMSVRFWWSLFLALPVVVLGMRHHGPAF